jgi:hypothetical protein
VIAEDNIRAVIVQNPDDPRSLDNLHLLNQNQGNDWGPNDPQRNVNIWDPESSAYNPNNNYTWAPNGSRWQE